MKQRLEGWIRNPDTRRRLYLASAAFALVLGGSEAVQGDLTAAVQGAVAIAIAELARRFVAPPPPPE